MADSTFATGGCSCGSVTYTITAEPKAMVQCHCLDCQKATGTGHISLAFFSQDDVVISGETKGFTTTTDSGNQTTRYFCPTCGSRLYGLNTGRPGLITIAVGSVDDHSWYAPKAVVYTKRKQDWDLTDSKIPNFEAMPPAPPK